jgi:hypothetical protein
LANIIRDQGKRLETKLFKEWDKAPSIRFLRLRDNTIQELTKQQYHTILSERTGIEPPSKEFENNQPEEADKIYQSWSDYLRSTTRDKNKYPLVFKELINYGFRRNTTGVKIICLWESIICLLVIIVKGFLLYRISKLIDSYYIFGSVIITIYLCIVIFFINKQGVKSKGDDYARQLLETLNICS